MATQQFPSNTLTKSSESDQPSNGLSYSEKSFDGQDGPSPDYAALVARLARKERDLLLLTDRLRASETELTQIKASKGWRWLGYFWYMRNEIVLPKLRPFLRLLGKSAPQPEAPQPASAAQQWSLQSEQDLSFMLPGVTSLPKAFDIVCFPIIDWDFRFQRPQQLMMQFAAAGHRVFYIQHKFCGTGKPFEIQEKALNIYEVSLSGTEACVYRDQLNAEQCSQLLQSLNALRRELGLGATVSIVQLPFWWSVAEQARQTLGWPVVYDCMDYHAGFSTNAEEMLKQEQLLFSSSDLVVVSSPTLAEEAKKFGADPLLIRNACEYEHFAQTSSAANKNPVIGYYGAISDWFDSNLVADLAERRPDWNFVLVGATTLADISRLSNLPNVNLPGEQPYTSLPRWLSQFDATIIPFKRTPLTEATNPVKAYEILAAGKPLISVPLPEIIALGSVVQLASTASEFEREIENAIKNDSPELVQTRRDFAHINTWQDRHKTLSQALPRAFAKVSIIIVTYNNLNLNRLCLERLYERTEWPNLEVIVIDNASTDGTPEYLKQAKLKYPNLQIVLNDQNLGFAAANNIGLKIASGEYLVLLNNDTVVTRGWLSTLIRHLINNPQIGLIGPVTNNIGNNAKIPVGYQNLYEMQKWAAGYVHQHDNELFEIPMVAMFCVVMRRQLFEQIGLLDERFRIGMFEDDDYSRRVKNAGYDIRCARDSFIHHWQKSSFKLLGEDAYLQIFEENRKKYEEKWGESWRAEGLNIWKRADLGYYRDQLMQVIERIGKSKGVVIFLPSVSWNIVLFQRPHHLARTFAQMGYVAIFDSNNTNDDVNGFKEIEPNLFLFKGPTELLHELPNPILWTFTYNYDQQYSYSQTARTIYDWIDDLEVFPHDQNFLADNHLRATQEATVVTSVAKGLHQQILETRPDALYLPNGVEDWRFASDAAPLPTDQELEKFLQSGNPIAGYYGALASWFDYDLINETAKLRPDWNFLLIGPNYDNSLNGRPMLDRPNVRWIGPREYQTLPGYLRAFDVATIPFVINNITLATSPLKLYEYFAGAKPVITSAMPECMAFPEVQIVRNASEFSEALDQARERGRDEQFRGRLREIARQNSWKTRAKTAIEHLIGEPLSDEDQSIAPPPLTGPALRVAEKFHHFRTATNQRFFAALSNHLSGLLDNPCLAMYFEFAITSNERGQNTAELIRQYTPIAGKRYLDVGCAYGGFLVAFARAGATVTGLDIDESLLRLARYNLQDQAVQAPLLLRDATQRDSIVEFENNLDIITCNDVIEHVDNPTALVRNISELLTNNGLAYFEIPNALAPLHVLSDGHYQLFGITLLDYPKAEEYFSVHFPNVGYAVRHYLTFKQYEALFAAHGLMMTFIDDSADQNAVNTILQQAADLRAEAGKRLNNFPALVSNEVAETWRNHIGSALIEYLNTLESTPLNTEDQRREFLRSYGYTFWRIVVRKQTPA